MASKPLTVCKIYFYCTACQWRQGNIVDKPHVLSISGLLASVANASCRKRLHKIYSQKQTRKQKASTGLFRVLLR